jgi:HEAT repeat protein
LDLDKLELDLTSPDEHVRREAVLAITEAGEPELAELLKKATTDPSPAVRFFARRGLDKLSRLEGAPRTDAWSRALAEAAGDRISTKNWRLLLADPDPEKRVTHVLATLKIQDPSILPLLWERLRPETDSRVRASLVKAIGRFRKRDSFDVLALLLNDADPRVRANAIEALDELADVRLEPLLGPMLGDPDNRIRGNALKAMARFSRPRALAGAHEMAASADVWMRSTAVWLYRELGGEQAKQALQRMLHRETGEMAEKLRTVLQAIEKRQLDAGPVPELALDSEVLSTIRQKLDDADPKVRIQGIYQATELPRGKALPMLKVVLLSETDPFVLATLVKAVGQTGSAAEVELVAEFLNHADARVRANAIEGLAALGSEAAYELVEPMLKDPNQRVRANAAWLIHGRDPAQAFAELKQMLLSPDSSVQDSALFALREIDTEQVLEILETGLASNNPEVPIKILKVLESWGHRNKLAAKLYETYKEMGQGLPWVTDRLDELLDRMNRGSAPDRVRTLELLATFHESRARRRLEGATRDPDAAVRRRAKELLRQAEADEAKRQAWFRLGLAAYQWIRDARPAIPGELSNIVARAKQATNDLDRGKDVLGSLTLRRQTIADLGREMYLLVSTGQLTARPLESSVQEIARLEMKQQSAGLPTPLMGDDTRWKSWLRLGAGTFLGTLLAIGIYLAFKMPPQPNLKPLKLKPRPADGSSAAAGTLSTVAVTASTAAVSVTTPATAATPATTSTTFTTAVTASVPVSVPSTSSVTSTASSSAATGG